MMAPSVRVLIIEDSEDDALLLVRLLRQVGKPLEYRRVETTAALQQALATESWDLLLVDWKLPGFDGWQALKLIKASGKDIPFIIVSGVIGEETAVAAMKAGAHDFVRKDQPARLVPVVERELADAAVRRARSQAEASLAVLTADLDRQVAERTALLEATNKELEAFSYSISHDLQAPLRGLDGFSQILLEDYAPQLDAVGQDYLRRIRRASQRMGQLINDLLMLSRFGLEELHKGPVDLGEMAAEVAHEWQATAPERAVEWVIPRGLRVHGDPRLLRVALDNMLGNAWKFTAQVPAPRIELGTYPDGPEQVYFVRDNGAGFDMAYVEKLFTPFSRLHTADAFEGSGIGLALVHRIIWRHGGRVWAEGRPGAGATFYFTLA
jgi:signal transduction histidine kinase